MKKWIINSLPSSSDEVRLHNNNLINNLLIARGIKNQKEAKEFLKADLCSLNNPFSMKDIDRALDRIDKAIRKREKVLIYGDYDVDGITSTSILYRALNKLGIDVSYYIPDRINEGYGINKEAIDYINGLVIDLIITVDCGISSIEEVEYAKSLGMDIIVTDHHECKNEIPNTIVINPKRKDCNYPYKFLAGCGVAFKLVQALWIKYNLNNFEDFLDIAAIGTIADVVDLTGENRVIVKEGLRRIQNSEKCGIKALKSVINLKKELTSTNIAFQMAPRINAAGRLSDAKIAVELFITSDYDKALQIAKYLDLKNKKRQEIEDAILKEAINKIDNEIDLVKDRIIVLSSKKWHIGVVGIVASKLLERYSRPVILFCEEGKTARGSGRSIHGFNLFENLYKCSDLLQRFGGHELAAGLSINIENIDSLRDRLNSLAHDVDIEFFTSKLYIDDEVESQDITFDTVETLNLFEPFGAGNPLPVFFMKNVDLLNKRFIGNNGQHAKLIFEKDNKKINGIMFNGTRDLENKLWSKVDIAFNMDINEWNNIKDIQFNIKGIRPQINWVKENIKDNYYKILKNYISSCFDSDDDNEAESGCYDFKGISLLEKDIDFIKEFVYFNKGYILTSTMIAFEEIEFLLKSLNIDFSNDFNSDVQLIICPDIAELDLKNKSVLIYDFLPSGFNYKELLKKTEQKIYNFYNVNSCKQIDEFVEDISLDKDVMLKLYEDLSQGDLTCTISNVGKMYNINPYKAYNTLRTLKNNGYINMFIKGELLKVQRVENSSVDFDKLIENDISKNEVLKVRNGFSKIIQKTYN